MASHLCLPSPSVDLGGWVGKNTVRGGALIDHYGDTVMNCKHLPGDTWRQRHDTGRLAIVNECVNAGLVHDCEVIGLFADLIPSQADNHRWEDLQWRRPRQVLIPDFRLRLPIPWGRPGKSVWCSSDPENSLRNVPQFCSRTLIKALKIVNINVLKTENEEHVSMIWIFKQH